MFDPIGKRLVIVGAGLAGDRCAFAARAAGFAGEIVLIGAETVRPYDRPPLSKQVLKSQGEEDAIFYRDEADYAEARIDLMLGRPVAAIDRIGACVAFIGGDPLAYDRLVLATGSRLRVLPDLPHGAPGIFYLRDRDDAVRLREAFAKGGRVAVVGGGVIGLEAAACAISHGLSVIVIEPQARIMARACGETMAALLAERHRAAGVEICCGAGLHRATRTDAYHRLELSDGRILDAEIVIVGVGVIPETRLAVDAGLDVVPGGIVVDGQGRTSDPAIFAAGEVAYHYNARTGMHERQENWHHAAAHGEHVGRVIASAGEDYAELSGFWTDQYDLSVQTTGSPLAERDVLRGDPSEGRFILFHIEGETLVGATGINAASELRQAKLLIRSAAKIDPLKLADPAIKISSATA
jgi:3-phenylpropionate/trans-cinnamate dioxygenase ferredoxin reductase subunit